MKKTGTETEYSTEEIVKFVSPFNVHNVKVIIHWTVVSSVPMPKGIEIETLDKKAIITRAMLVNLPLSDILRAHLEKTAPKKLVSQADINKHITHGKGRPLSKEAMKIIGDLYIEAGERGEPVQRYISERIGKSISATAKAIHTARQEGYIPEELNTEKMLPRVSVRV